LISLLLLCVELKRNPVDCPDERGLPPAPLEALQQRLKEHGEGEIDAENDHYDDKARAHHDPAIGGSPLSFGFTHFGFYCCLPYFTRGS